MFKMKEIEINGDIFQYKVFWDTSEYGDSEWTEFYQGVGFREVKRFFFFGPKVKIYEPILKFQVHMNIESPSYTKEKVRSMVMEEYHRTVGKEKRRIEILNGEII